MFDVKFVTIVREKRLLMIIDSIIWNLIGTLLKLQAKVQVEFLGGVSALAECSLHPLIDEKEAEHGL